MSILWIAQIKVEHVQDSIRSVSKLTSADVDAGLHWQGLNISIEQSIMYCDTNPKIIFFGMLVTRSVTEFVISVWYLSNRRIV